MQHKHHSDIAESFHSKRVDSLNVVLVLNADNYVMAEYSRETGVTTWHRVVKLPQRDRVERGLAEKYPIETVSTPVTIPTVRASKRGAKK